MGGRAAYQPIVELSKEKLEIFLKSISSGTLGLPAVQHALSLPSGQINVLKALIPLYTSKVPWGGIAYHYSSISQNSLDPDDVFEKLILRGRGGHCLEMVPLFASALLALGYNLYLTGARVSSALTKESEPGFHGWSHVVLILTISGQKYVVDPQIADIFEPALLNPHGPDVVFDSIPTNIIRLRYCPLAEVVPNRASNSGLMTWLFEMKHSKEAESWMPIHIFSPDTEWYLEDLPVMNVWLAKAPESYLVTEFKIKRLLIVGADGPSDNRSMRAVSGFEEGGFLIVPKVSGSAEMNVDHLVVWRNGEKVVDEIAETEVERINILKKWFGMELTLEEAAAILSRPTALRH